MARDEHQHDHTRTAWPRPSESTVLVPPEKAGGSRSGAFRDRARVRVTLLETHTPETERTGEIGSGHLLDRLAVGTPLRIALEEAPALVTSPVRGVQRLGVHAVQVITANSIYRLDRCEGAPPAPPEPDAAREDAEAPSSVDDDTAFVPLNRLGPLAATPFGSGERMRISRIKTHDHGSERLGELGTGRVLDRLEIGQLARISIEGGPTFVTSPVRAIHRIGESVIEVATTNSTYRLRKLDPSGS